MHYANAEVLLPSFLQLILTEMWLKVSHRLKELLPPKDSSAGY